MKNFYLLFVLLFILSGFFIQYINKERFIYLVSLIGYYLIDFLIFCAIIISICFAVYLIFK